MILVWKVIWEYVNPSFRKRKYVWIISGYRISACMFNNHTYIILRVRRRTLDVSGRKNLFSRQVIIFNFQSCHWRMHLNFRFHASEIPSRQPSSVSRTNFTTKDFLRTLEKNGFGENPHLKSTRTYPYTRSHKVQMHSISNKNTNPTSASGKKLHESTWRQNEEWCSWFRGLAPRQHRMCLENPDLVAAAMRGTDIAVRECQRQFSYDRWNCSLILTNVVVRSRTRSDQHLSYVNQKGVGGYRKEDIKGEVLARGLRNGKYCIADFVCSYEYWILVECPGLLADLEYPPFRRCNSHLRRVAGDIGLSVYVSSIYFHNSHEVLKWAMEQTPSSLLHAFSKRQIARIHGPSTDPSGHTRRGHTDKLLNICTITLHVCTHFV